MDYWSTKVKIYSYALLILLLITLICYLIHIFCKLRMMKNAVTKQHAAATTIHGITVAVLNIILIDALRNNMLIDAS
ncbi:hypothetical protein [African swine fever virus]